MTFEQKSYGVVVECALCRGTGRKYPDHAVHTWQRCEGCNGAGRQALRFLPQVETLHEADSSSTKGAQDAND